ncbi:MAG TPA: hypothetical protein VFV37_00275 [Luteibaculaceae bacterium]|nr:hypothetical protein [Luteibaculaceae bacterium]
MSRFLFFAFCVFFVTSLRSQSKVNLISGQILLVENIEIDSVRIKVTFVDAKQKQRTKVLYFEDVLSVERSPGEVEFYYNKVEDQDGLLEPRDMVFYVDGLRSGREQYRPLKPVLLGFSAGVLAGASLNSVLYGLLIPPFFTLATKAFPVSKRRFAMDEREAEDAFLFGRRFQYKKMRTGTYLKANAAGVVVGLIAGALLAR